MPLTQGDYHHAVQPPTSIGVPIGHAEIEQAASVQLSQVNEESSVTNVRIAVLALVGSDARHGTTTFWSSR
jgi:hypothetical protein